MTTPSHHPPILAHRAAAVVAGLVLVFGLAGCGSDGASTDCGLNACTVTFDRGVEEAQANVLGVEAKLVGADGDRVTIEVAGERLSLTVGQQAVEVGGLFVSVDRADDSQVVLRIAADPAG